MLGPRFSVMFAVMIFLTLPASLSLAIHEQILFQTVEEAQMDIRLENLTSSPFILSWSLPAKTLLGEPRVSGGVNRATTLAGPTLALKIQPSDNKSTGQITFRVRTACRDGGAMTFPIPDCNISPSTRTLRVLLPKGWIALRYPAECQRRYDANTGRIALYCENAEPRHCFATLSIPGSKNKRLRNRMEWVVIRGYLLTTVILASLAMIGILLYRLFRSRGVD